MWLINAMNSLWFTEQSTTLQFLSDDQLIIETSTYTVRPILTLSYCSNSYLCTYKQFVPILILKKTFCYVFTTLQAIRHKSEKHKHFFLYSRFTTCFGLPRPSSGDYYKAFKTRQNIVHTYLLRACCSLVLKALRYQSDRSPVVSLGIFSEASDKSMCPGSTKLLKVSSRIFLGVKAAGVEG